MSATFQLKLAYAPPGVPLAEAVALTFNALITNKPFNKDIFWIVPQFAELVKVPVLKSGITLLLEFIRPKLRICNKPTSADRFNPAKLLEPVACDGSVVELAFACKRPALIPKTCSSAGKFDGSIPPVTYPWSPVELTFKSPAKRLPVNNSTSNGVPWPSEYGIFWVSTHALLFPTFNSSKMFASAPTFIRLLDALPL